MRHPGERAAQLRGCRVQQFVEILGHPRLRIGHAAPGEDAAGQADAAHGHEIGGVATDLATLGAATGFGHTTCVDRERPVGQPRDIAENRARAEPRRDRAAAFGALDALA